MAKASAKKLAQQNEAALNRLHTITAGIFIAVAVIQYLRGKPFRRSFIMCIPMLGFEYVLEKSGRPKHNGRELVSPGQDLSQSGLTEYMHDVIYFTWICLVLSLLTAKAWWLYLIVPAFAGYKALQLLKAGKQLLTGGAGAQQPNPPVPAASGSPDAPQPQNRRERRARV